MQPFSLLKIPLSTQKSHFSSHLPNPTHGQDFAGSRVGIPSWICLRIPQIPTPHPIWESHTGFSIPPGIPVSHLFENTTPGLLCGKNNEFIKRCFEQVDCILVQSFATPELLRIS
jgi:hypothetical protein